MLIRVSAASSPFKAAGAIAAVIRQSGKVSVQAIGAPALNQAMKAIIYARGYLEQDGLDIAFVPVFNDIELDGVMKTAVRFEIESFPRAGSSPQGAPPAVPPSPE